MAGNKKAAGTVTVGGVILVAVVLGSKMLGGPDLTALLRSDGASSASSDAAVTPDRETSASDTGRQTQPTGKPASDAGTDSPAQNPPETTTTVADETAIRQLIDNEISGEMVELYAEVVKLLPDDNEGSRHQRLLLKLDTGGTVLVAHNIDLAERIPVNEGEWLTVYGQYEWNDRGGVLHWTHHDPKNWREGGWIEHAGVRYE